MSLIDLFENGERKSQKGHFSNLLSMAKSDGQVSPEESALMWKIARHLGLTTVQVEDITSRPENYPMSPPADLRGRTSRIVDMVAMLHADGEIDQHELNALHRFSAGLGFSEERTAYIVNKVINGLRDGADRTLIEQELNR